ncbi:MAG: DUF4330 domain-containing protein [Clostridia bacterium]|nr:DUF4330 domain-containing protein [Clostridia bacterium]
MSTTAKKNRLFRFNVIDAVIILVILCAVGSIFVRYNLEENISISGHSESVEIKFLITSLDHSSSDSFKEGDSVFFSSNSKLIGTLTSEKTIIPAEIMLTLSDGSVVKSESPGAEKVDLRGSILSNGVFDEDGSFMLDGNTFIAPGMKISLYTENIITDCIITEIKRMEQ